MRIYDATFIFEGHELDVKQVDFDAMDRSAELHGVTAGKNFATGCLRINQLSDDQVLMLLRLHRQQELDRLRRVSAIFYTGLAERNMAGAAGYRKMLH